MLLESARQLVPLRLLHRDEILDTDRIEQLATEPLGGNAGAYSLARRIDGGCRTGGSATHDQDVERLLGADLRGLALCRARIELAEDLRQLHTALTERRAVQEYRRNTHDLAPLHFVLKYGAIDHRVADPRIERRHDIERLHHLRTALAGEGYECLEVQFAVEILDLINGGLIHFRRIAAGLQQRQHQGGKFMAHGHAGETHVRFRSRTPQRERWR